MSSWSLNLVPDASRDDGSVFVEVSSTAGVVHRVPHALWPKQPTASPGGAGDAAHEAWLLANIRYRECDVVVTTYPKCGTTLTEQIVLLLLNGGSTDKLDPLSKNAANLHGGLGKVWPEACVMPDSDCARSPPGRPPKEEMIPLALSAFEALPSPRLIKTHAPVGKVLGRSAENALGPARYVVVSRNPLDACVSCYYHAWNPHRQGWPFEAFAEVWLDGLGNGSFGSWFDFHRGWMEATLQLEAAGDRPGARILWVQYEELVREPTPQITRIAEYLGCSNDPSLIARVVEGSKFETMKSLAVKAEEAGGRNMSSEHIRKGGIGDWRNHFTPSLEARFRRVFEERMRGSGLKFDIGGGEVLEAPP